MVIASNFIEWISFGPLSVLLSKYYNMSVAILPMSCEGYVSNHMVAPWLESQKHNTVSVMIASLLAWSLIYHTFYVFFIF